MTDLAKMGLDIYHKKPEKYSLEDTQKAFINELIALNNGSTKLDYRAIRDGKCSGLFALIEEILSVTVPEGLREDDFFMQHVDFRNLALGDKNEFYIDNGDLFEVSEIADGSTAVRRQRINKLAKREIPTTYHAIRIYDDLSRVLSGRVDFNELINSVAKSYRKGILNDIYDLWNGLTYNELGDDYILPNSTTVVGSYDEDKLLGIVEHVEAAAEKSATIIGTKAGLRALAASIMGDSPKEDLYNLGYFGKFYGTPVVAVPQRYKADRSGFQFDDKKVYVVATGDKPFKFVYEGDDLVIPGDPLKNADLTQEYMFASKYGSGLVMDLNPGIGVYEFN